MSLTRTTYGLIGVGSIAAALVEGIKRIDPTTPIVLSPRGAGTAASLAARHRNVRIAADNQAAASHSDVVFLCVRPADAEPVLQAVSFRADQIVVSAMAGVTLEKLKRWIAPATPCRVIPLPSIADGKGPTPIYPPLDRVRDLFDALGGSLEVADEAQFDAFSAVTGTIAAHFRYLGTIADWLAGRGVGPIDAERYVAGMFASLDLGTNLPDRRLDDLVREHSTPGGLNEAFALMLEVAGLSQATKAGLDRLFARLEEPR